MDMRTRSEGILLTKGDYYGTLAAARCIGSTGVPVCLAESSRLTQTGLSRFVTRGVRAPAIEPTQRFAAWLQTFGREQPGMFLYSTCDDMSWILASRREELRRHYRMYQPPLDTIATLLDKRRLYAACQQLGIDAPRTWAPESARELEELARSAEFPLLIKPRTQMLLNTKRKGRLVMRRGDLVDSYRRFRRDNTYAREILDYDPHISWPLLQHYLPGAGTDTYSLSGFISRGGHIFVVRAARKLFQRPARFGIGLCFRAAPVMSDLSERVRELARYVGYYGVFEAEFVRDAGGGPPLLIDFNPRFFGQMGFDIARGLPLPVLAYDAAHGSHQVARRVAQQRDVSYDTWWSGSRWLLRLAMLTQSLSGRLAHEDRVQLRRLLHDPRMRGVDAVGERGDPGPLLADVVVNLWHFARHPRDFARTFLQA